MNIAIFGLGYVGLANAAYLSGFHRVRGFDINEIRIQQLKDGLQVLAEPQLQETLNKHAGKLTYTWDPSEALEEAEVVIVALPTPEQADGSPDLSHFFEAAEVLYKLAPQGILLINRSTVPPGTQTRLKTYFNNHQRSDIRVVSVPEFLSQGQALKNVMSPSRFVVGSDDEVSAKQVVQLYRYAKAIPLVVTSPVNAELIKYASNAFLASKISFMNEMSRLAELVNADIEVVAQGMGYDPRIGSSFLKAGLGFGGSCFPKDLHALIHLAGQNIATPLMQSVLTVNQTQVQRFMDRFFKRMKSIKQKKIAVLGLAFKGDTLDVRHSLAYDVIQRLVDQQAKIFAFDPRSTLVFFEGRSEAPCIAYTDVLEEALNDADAVIICNDDTTIKQLTSQTFIKRMKTPIVFDGRNLFSLPSMASIEYHSIGRPSNLPKKK
jgi:UDPglucose 6-dehydrogenase